MSSTVRCAAAVCAAVLVAAFTSAADADFSARFEYQIETPGRVSLGVYNQQGRLVRTLLRAEPRRAGTHTAEWDGLDRYGRPLSPGQYEWRLLRSEGLRAKYLTTLGINPPNEPYTNWVGNHRGPQSVAVDDTGLYINAGGENVLIMLKQALDGSERHWSGRHRKVPYNGAIATAVWDGKVYNLGARGGLFVIDGETGESLELRWAKWDRDAEPKRGHGKSEPRHNDVSDMDVAGDHMVVMFREHDALRWYDRESGEIVAEQTVADPRGVTINKDGTAYVISEGRIHSVRRDGTRSAVVADKHLNHAFRLDFDLVNQQLFVAERAPGAQVKRFNLDGELLATHGRAGGRREGAYVPTDFHKINDITADRQGGFVIASGYRAMRRTAHFNGDGELVNEWFGGQPFFNVADADPANPREVYFMAGFEDRSRARINLSETDRWQMQANYRMGENFEGFWPGASNPRRPWRLRRINGEIYFINTGVTGVFVKHLDREAQTVKPFACLAMATHKNDDSPFWKRLLDNQDKTATQPEKSPGAFAWQDENGDGDIQYAEVHLAKLPASAPLSSAWLHDDWDIYFAGYHYDTNGEAWFHVPHRGADDANAPRWRWADLTPSNAKLPETLRNGEVVGGPHINAVRRDAAGRMYLLASTGGPGADRHGGGWPTYRRGTVRVLGYDAQGQLKFNIGRHATENPHDLDTPAPAWQLHNPIALIGAHDETITVADRAVNPGSVWTHDGLFVGSVLDRRADDGLPERLYHWWRSQRRGDLSRIVSPIPYDMRTGGSMTALPDGDVLWLPMGQQASPVYRVDGWQNRTRRSGAFTLSRTPPHAAAQGEGLTGRFFNNQSLNGEPALEQVSPHIWFADYGRNDIINWRKGPGDGVAARHFSARWRGRVEAPLSEAFRFTAYTDKHSRVRLWINGRLVLEHWPEQMKETRPRVTAQRLREVVGDSLALNAGGRYDVRLEYSHRGDGPPELSLNWESETMGRQRIKQKYLYPRR